MARRRKSVSKDEAGAIGLGIVIILIVYVISEVVEFFKENMWLLYLIISLIALSIIVVLYFYIKKRKDYKNSLFYEQTLLPYKDLKKPGVYFEFFVFSKLCEFLENSTCMVNVLMQREDALNEHFEIDLLLFSQKGIFVLELKDWKGMIYGGKTSHYWTRGKSNKGSKSVNQFYNPMLQNNKHVEDLKKVVNFEYKSFIIFSERADLGSKIEGVGYLSDFFDYYNSLPIQYPTVDIEEIESQISRKICRDMSRKHIERIQYNKLKYKRK